MNLMLYLFVRRAIKVISIWNSISAVIDFKKVCDSVRRAN
jgi:hypothetical protein